MKFDFFIYKCFKIKVATPDGGPSVASILAGPRSLPEVAAPDVGPAYGAMAEQIERWYRESGPPREGR